MSQTRERRIEFIKRRLLRKSAPRLQVSLILLVTGLVCFLTSYSLLHVGIYRMWVRYPVAILFAYWVFLMLLGLWLSLHHRRGGDTYFDLSLPDVDLTALPDQGTSFEFGGGADFSGGGAGGSFGEGVSTAKASVGGGGGGGSHSGGFSFDLDLDEGWLVVVAIVAILGGLIATLYIVYIAPALLAEIMVDGLLVSGLYRQAQLVERRHWLRGALRRTLLPALLVMLFFSAAGFALQKAYPKARSLGEAWGYAWKTER